MTSAARLNRKRTRVARTLGKSSVARCEAELRKARDWLAWIDANHVATPLRAELVRQIAIGEAALTEAGGVHDGR